MVGDAGVLQCLSARPSSPLPPEQGTLGMWLVVPQPESTYIIIETGGQTDLMFAKVRANWGPLLCLIVAMSLSMQVG